MPGLAGQPQITWGHEQGNGCVGVLCNIRCSEVGIQARGSTARSYGRRITPVILLWLISLARRASTLNAALGMLSLYFTRMRANELTTLTLDPSRGGVYGKYAEDVDQLWRGAEGTLGANLFELIDAQEEAVEL